MTKREEYVEKMKSQLDQWNAEAARWEDKMKHAEADMKSEYQRQLEALHSRRDEAMYQLHQLQVASTDAWMDMMRGVEEAWKRMGEAVGQARSHFEKK
jgi:lipid II:glycine glycyltransferase (peptidoglycan interpeptide bridge formation enzyme)